jgi:hypothetical protein
MLFGGIFVVFLFWISAIGIKGSVEKRDSLVPGKFSQQRQEREHPPDAKGEGGNGGFKVPSDEVHVLVTLRFK